MPTLLALEGDRLSVEGNGDCFSGSFVVVMFRLLIDSENVPLELYTLFEKL
jgi:hypothetical protein